MADGLQHGYQPLGVVTGEALAHGQPVRCRGISVGGAELKPVVSPGDGGGDAFNELRPCGLQAGQFPGHAVVLVAGKRCRKAFQRRPGPLLGGRIGDVEPDRPVGHVHRVAPHLVAANQGLARLQVEFPVVPVAGEDAATVELALHQGIALVGAAVVAGEDTLVAMEQGDLLALDSHHHLALGREVVHVAHAHHLGFRAVHGIFARTIRFHDSYFCT